MTFEEEPWKNVTSDAKDFILKLLKKDPRKRWTAQQVGLRLLASDVVLVVVCGWFFYSNVRACHVCGLSR